MQSTACTKTVRAVLENRIRKSGHGAVSFPVTAVFYLCLLTLFEYLRECNGENGCTADCRGSICYGFCEIYALYTEKIRQDKGKRDKQYHFTQKGYEQ